MNLTPPTPLWRLANGPIDEKTHAMQTAIGWLASDSWSLVMLGDPGRGKSAAMAWLWDRLREEAIVKASQPSAIDSGTGRPIYKRAGETLWLRARELDLMGWDDRAAVLRRAEGAYGLLVDEIGSESDRARMDLSSVIEARGDNGRRTAMTSNMPRAEFGDRYGDRLISRLRAGGLDNGRPRWVVDIRGPDLRGRVCIPHQDVDIPPDEPVSDERKAEILAELAPSVARMMDGE